MKTATVTWITYNNYGTLLQAYALQKAVQMLGHENVILSDKEILKEFRASRPKNVLPKRQEPVPEPQTARLKRILKDPGRLWRMVLARKDPERYEYPYEASEKACDEFREEQLLVRHDVRGDALAALNEEYDAFLCGSDQIWSPRELNFNPYYYLDFAQKKKIAYGPSLGTDKIPEDKAETIKSLLQDFEGLSVREDISAEQLTELTGRDVRWVADPTLLHDKTFWTEFASGVKQKKKKYLLCYFLENKAWYFDYARKVSQKMGLKLLLIPNRWDYLQHSFVADFAVGPKEFVALFRDASYVLTDSYHGSIFSLIFEKQFQYLQRFAENDVNSQNVRIQSLFGLLELEDRIIAGTARPDPTETKYPDILQKLRIFREESRGFLADSMR